MDLVFQKTRKYWRKEMDIEDLNKEEWQMFLHNFPEAVYMEASQVERQASNPIFFWSKRTRNVGCCVPPARFARIPISILLSLP
jgi:hypothetical protein